jgi:hypothetical protein
LLRLYGKTSYVNTNLNKNDRLPFEVLHQQGFFEDGDYSKECVGERDGILNPEYLIFAEIKRQSHL